jgi:hypothetical protein
MASRTRYNIICNCGHKGTIILSENDQPYSSNWEQYSLENLEGTTFTTRNVVTWETVFEKTGASCPTLQ